MADAPVSVFISYSRTDSAFIDRLEADLRAYGFDTWVDRQHLEGGADWARLIEQQIAQRETLVVALSPDAITSTWVRREIMFALSAGKRIIPIIARPVEQAPFEIIELQRIDLSADYASGLQDLRVALLNTRALPPPPKPVQAPQPLLTLPDVSDPLKGLVEIPPTPPAPNPDLAPSFMQAQSALAHGNLDLAEALLARIVEQEPDFGNGLATEELAKVRKQLEPTQIERLRAMADQAHAGGAFGQEVGALRALAARLPDDDAIASRLTLAQDCQKWAWLYDNARGFAQARDAAAVTVALTQLWERAPYFGDPAGIAPPGLAAPQLAANQINARRYSVLEQGHVFAKVAAHKGGVKALRWSPDGRLIVTAGADHVARVASAETGEAVYAFTAHTGPVKDVAWSPDSRSVASASDDGTVCVWRAHDGARLFTFYLPRVGIGRTAAALCVDWLNDGVKIVAGGWTQRSSDSPSAVNLCWDASAGAQLFSKQVQASSPRESFFTSVMRGSPDAKWVAMATIGRSVVRTSANLDADSAILSGAQALALAWATDSVRIAVGTAERSFFVAHTSNGWLATSVATLFTCGGHAGDVRALGWSPDGARITSASDDGVRLWDASDGKLLFAYSGHSAPVTALAWSPDSTRIASADQSGELRIWRA